MAKPSRKRTRSTKARKRTPAAAKPPVEAKAKVVSAPAPEAPNGAEGSAEGGAQRPLVAADGAAPEAPKTPVGVETIMLGKVKGQLHHVPVDAVVGILSEAMLSRIEVLRSHASIEAVQQRMLATDGRATPAIFTYPDDRQEGFAKPDLFAGVEAIAAAQNLGRDSMFVITVPAGDAGDVQSHLVEAGRKQPTDSEDDLYVRVLADDDD